MPRKRKAAALKGAGGKKVKTAAAANPEPYAVYQDFSCMLNQTNIGHNNNKFFEIIAYQDLNGSFYVRKRWGRVGESGQHAMKGPLGEDAAVADFKKKFKEKTSNSWDERSNFTPVAGKYVLLEMDDDVKHTAKKKVTANCSLDKPTQDLVKLLFDKDMFKEAMKDLEIDVKKMPLGKLSKAQIDKGFKVLEEIEDALKQKKNDKTLEQLSNDFYMLIPHDFGRRRPPIMTTEEQVRKKMDILNVLKDIEMAQAMLQTKTPSMTKDSQEVPHPLDLNYIRLHCDLDLLDKKDKEFKVLETYLKQTRGDGGSPQILDIWKVNRHTENSRFLAHDSLDNRRLLWHGTKVAVVVAILKEGLRIMPHKPNGCRVGNGIYFASENGKSAEYVGRASGNIGIMFLNEVPLGKEHHITMEDETLTSPPKGYDCVIAKGHTEPDPRFDTTLMIDKKKVVVPQGKPVPQSEYSDSKFTHSEYLVYKESQNRIRYLLKLKFKKKK